MTPTLSSTVIPLGRARRRAILTTGHAAIADPRAARTQAGFFANAWTLAACPAALRRPMHATIPRREAMVEHDM